LTIHGNGKVIYYGIENVKHKGIAEKNIKRRVEVASYDATLFWFFN
jgi:hypothetical protein